MELDNSDFYNYIKYLVPDFTNESWAVLKSTVKEKSWKKGDTIIEPGCIENYVHYLSKGLIRFYYLIDGKEHTITILGENCMFSEYLSFLTRKPTLLYIEALEDVEVISLNYDTIQFGYKHNKDFETLGRRAVEDVYILMFERNSDLLTLTPTERYLKLIETRPDILQRAPQYIIASFLGITPEALSRIRRKLVTKKK